MTKLLIGLLIGLLLGAACRVFDLPIPAPPNLMGAFLVLSVTIGFLLADGMVRHFKENPPKDNQVEVDHSTSQAPSRLKPASQP